MSCRRSDRPFDPGITSIHILRNSCLTNGDALANGFSCYLPIDNLMEERLQSCLRLFDAHAGFRRPKTSVQRKRSVVQAGEIGARKVVPSL